MNIAINTSELLNILLSSGFISMIALVLRLQTDLTKAKKDIEYLTEEVKKLRNIIEKCILDNKL